MKHSYTTVVVSTKRLILFTTQSFSLPLYYSYRFDEFDSLLEQYRYNLVGRSLPLETNCEGLCRKETLCQVQNIISTDYLKCVGRQ